MTVSRKIGGRDVNPVGLGCMNVSWAYAAPPPPEEAAKLLNRALDLGYNHLDTARLYGGGKNELLLGEALKGRRHEFYLASKMGIFADGDRRYVDCKPETIRREVEISLKALQTDYIDLYYMHRRDFTVPLEDTAGCFADLIREGKVGGYGLSEFSADSLRKSHAVCPVTAVQTEYSLWTRNPELGVLAATAELGVALARWRAGCWPMGCAIRSSWSRRICAARIRGLMRSIGPRIWRWWTSLTLLRCGKGPRLRNCRWLGFCHAGIMCMSFPARPIPIIWPKI